MKFEEYQKIIETFAVYPRDSELLAISYLALGLNGEAGEVADQVKKAIRNDGHISAERRAKILDEIGDVLWYITRLAIEFDTPLEVIAGANVEKLEKRRKTGGLKHE
ncbi:MAG: nucleoside triphosphate pyrophosphohydrolase family protein [Pyrinomonadaceae bacterium]